MNILYLTGLDITLHSSTELEQFSFFRITYIFFISASSLTKCQ